MPPFLSHSFPGEGGLGKLWYYLSKTLRTKTRRDITSFDVKETCKRQNIPIADVQPIKITCDISACFDPPQQLSKDGDILLDFLTHTVDFSKNVSAEYRDDLLRFLGSEACTHRGPAGEVILNTRNAAVIIQKH